MGINGRRRVKFFYREEDVMNRYAALYTSLQTLDQQTNGSRPTPNAPEAEPASSPA